MSETYDRIYSNDNPETPAGGWIQWKGTNVCIDLRCVCGVRGHFDGEFMYHVQCEKCGRKYAAGQNIKLIEFGDDLADLAPDDDDCKPL